VGQILRVLVGVGLVASTLGGCGDEPDCPERPTEVAAERAVDVPYEGPALDAVALSEGLGGFALQVANVEERVERVRIALDGVPALDVDLPADAGCSGGHGPVFTVAYERPPGPVEVTLDIQGSTSESTVVVPDDGVVWGVVQVQSQRSWGDLQVSDERPEWG
jgi:hypothetical protein